MQDRQPIEAVINEAMRKNQLAALASQSRMLPLTSEECSRQAKEILALGKKDK